MALAVGLLSGRWDCARSVGRMARWSVPLRFSSPSSDSRSWRCLIGQLPPASRCCGARSPRPPDRSNLTRRSRACAATTASSNRTSPYLDVSSFATLRTSNVRRSLRPGGRGRRQSCSNSAQGETCGWPRCNGETSFLKALRTRSLAKDTRGNRVGLAEPSPCSLVVDPLAGASALDGHWLQSVPEVGQAAPSRRPESGTTWSRP